MGAATFTPLRRQIFPVSSALRQLCSSRVLNFQRQNSQLSRSFSVRTGYSVLRPRSARTPASAVSLRWYSSATSPGVSQATGAPPGLDMVFLSASRKGNLTFLRRLVAEVESSEGLDKAFYSTLKTPDGKNALHLAAGEEGTTETCRFLVEELEFEINGTCDRGETPLFEALLARNQPNAIFLIESGAEVTKCNIFGDTPLHCVANSGPKEMVKLLVSKGADVNAISQRGTPLSFAARCGHLDVLQCLLAHKANPNPDVLNSPLIAAMSGEPYPNIKCMELLLKAGADPNCPHYLTTPLHFAATKLNEDTIRCLLKGGADPNMPDSVGYTPLERAALSNQHKAVKILFPVTSPIAWYPDWSIKGVMEYVQSKEVKAPKDVALFAKRKGHVAFQKENYLEAGNWYSEVVKFDPFNANVLSNLSLCFAKNNHGEDALGAAKMCVGLEPSWAKAHYRVGVAYTVLKDYEKAAKAFSQALDLDPGNVEIENAYRAAQAELN